MKAGPFSAIRQAWVAMARSAHPAAAHLLGADLQRRHGPLHGVVGEPARLAQPSPRRTIRE
jgi:hypothetical protein